MEPWSGRGTAALNSLSHKQLLAALFTSGSGQDKQSQGRKAARLAGAVKGAGHADDAVQASHADYGASVGLDAARDAVHGAHRDERARVVLWVAHRGNHLLDILCVAASAVSCWPCKRMGLRVAVAQSTKPDTTVHTAHNSAGTRGGLFGARCSPKLGSSIREDNLKSCRTLGKTTLAGRVL